MLARPGVLIAAVLLTWGCGTTRYDTLPEESLEAFEGVYPEQRFDYDDRMSISYTDVGQGPAVVFLHGLISDSHQWHLTMPAFERGRRLVALDFPGHGKSSQVSGAGYYSIERFAEITIALLDRLGIGRAVFVGNSMGGQTALYLAIHFPKRVAGLALVDPVGGSKMGFERWIVRCAMWMGVMTWFDERSLRSATEKMLEKNRDHPIVEAMIRKLLLRIRDPEGRERLVDMQVACFDSIIDTPTYDHLDRIQAPTWTCWGEEDGLADPDHGADILRGIRGSGLTRYPEIGHCPPLECPERFNRDLLRFLERLGWPSE